jgi:hypothetical protein
MTASAASSLGVSYAALVPTGGRRRRADWDAVLAVVRAIAAVDDSDAFGRVVLGELDRVVPFDFGAVDELDPRAKQVRATTHPTDVSRPPWGWEVYARYAPENPVIEYVQRTGDGSARRVSDFITQRSCIAWACTSTCSRRLASSIRSDGHYRPGVRC